jgi:hypothetical protein
MIFESLYCSLSGVIIESQFYTLPLSLSKSTNELRIILLVLRPVPVALSRLLTAAGREKLVISDADLCNFDEIHLRLHSLLEKTAPRAKGRKACAPCAQPTWAKPTPPSRGYRGLSRPTV